MLVYIIFLIFCVGFLINNKYRPSKKLFLLFLMLYVIMGFREFSVGTDTQSYVDEYIEGTSFFRGTDFGFAFLLELIRYFGFGSRGFILITTFFILCPIYIFIRKFDNSKFLSLFLYFTIGNFAFNMTGIRQSVAIGFFLLGLYLWYVLLQPKIKLIALIAILIIAGLMHGSAKVCILILPFIYISNLYIYRLRNLKYVLIISPIVCATFLKLFETVVTYFMTTKYEVYEADASNINLVAYFIIPYVLFLYSTWLLFRFKPADRFLIMCYFNALLYALAASASLYMPILARSGYYFSLPMFAFISYFTYKLPVEKRKLILSMVILLCITYFIMSTSGGILHIDDYSFSV